MSTAEACLIQLNDEKKQFISAFDVTGKEQRVSNALDKLQRETRVSPCGTGVEVIAHNGSLLCFVLKTVLLFPNQEMQDLFTRTLFATKENE